MLVMKSFIIVILVIERSFHIIVISHRCHFTGKYRGAVHPRCNLSLRKSNTIPVFANNLTGYDSHLFITRLLIQKVMGVVFRITRKNIELFQKMFLLILLGKFKRTKKE